MTQNKSHSWYTKTKLCVSKNYHICVLLKNSYVSFYINIQRNGRTKTEGLAWWLCQTKHWVLDCCLGKTADKWHLWYEPSQTCGDTGLLLSSIPWPYRPVLLILTSQNPCWRLGIVQPPPSSWSYPTTKIGWEGKEYIPV